MVARVLIMAGGTGGHIFPALAVADELRSRGVEVTWLGTKRGMESDVVPKAGIEIDWISVSGLRGNGLLGWLQAPVKLTRAILQTRKVFKHRQPQAVLGMGGFVTGPGGFVAWMMGCPLFIHEQNSIAGLTNKLLSRFARKVMTAFPSAFAVSGKVINVGNPLRKAITDLPGPEVRFAEHGEQIRLLVVGGSLGAAALNECVPRAIARLDSGHKPQVWHQTGKRNLDDALTHYREAGVEGQVVPFIENMAEAYAWADLVICRAGALTVSELAAVGVGSILVPYPHAVDDHQTGNAKYLVDAQAALCVQQNKLSAESLAETLASLFSDRAKLLSMAQAARELGRPNAARDVADICMEAVRV